MIRRLALTLVVLLLALAGAARADEPLKLRMGWVVTPPELLPVIFAQPGVAVHLGKSYTYEAGHFQGTPPMITALAAGQLDIVPFTYPTFATAIQNADMGDLRIIADEFQDGAPGYFTEPFMVLKASNIAKVEDLKGKVLATNLVGSGVDIAMRAMLKKHGLGPNDYTVVEVAFPNMKSVLLAGKVDLITASIVTAYDPELNEKARPLFYARDAVGRTQFSFLAARASFIKAHRAVLVDFLEDYLRAVRWYLDPKNHDAAVRSLADFTKLPPERFSSWIFSKKDQYRNPDGLPDLAALQRNLDTQKDIGYLKNRLEVVKYVDLSLVKEAAARLK